MTTVYTKPRCVQCTATKRYLDKHGITYQSVDVSADAEALEYIKSLGYLAAPVVVTGNTHWSGYQETLLSQIKDAA